MKILVIKLTSMGDVLHLMPALTDLQTACPDIRIDWVVEDSFQEIPHWHSIVDKVMTVSMRRWRKFSKQNCAEFLAFRRGLRSQAYDVVIDAQGLIKSAIIARNARLNKGGKRVGFCGQSIKESPAAWFYQQRISVDRQQHAIDRLRELFSQAFAYSHSEMPLDYSINQFIQTQPHDQPYLVLLHGTTWATKHVPRALWRELASVAIKAGYQIKLAWGNDIEKARAHWIAFGQEHVKVLPKMSLLELAEVIKSAQGVVAVDTGLGHLTAALGTPCVSIYGSTNAALTGAMGDKQKHIQTKYACSPCLKKQCDQLSTQVTDMPCYQTIQASSIWQSLQILMAQ